MPRNPEDDDLIIVTGGQRLGGWQQFRVTRGIERMPSDVEIRLTERSPGQIGKSIVEPGAPCEVFLGGDKMLTGYIDRYYPAIDAQDHQAVIVARSKVEDLIDCSPDIPPWNIRAPTIGTAAREICKAYNIEVSLPDGDFPLDSQYAFPVIPGMTCWQLLEELARSVPVLIWDDAEGRLVLSLAGSARGGSPLVEGVNMEVAEAARTMDQRYSIVKVANAGAVQGTAGFAHYFVEAHDNNTPPVPRKRVLMIVIDFIGPDAKWARQRAEWEIARRFGRSRMAAVRLTGWRDANDKLWQANSVVHLKSESLDLDEDQAISEVSFERGRGGTQTLLHLMPVKGLLPQPFHPRPPVDDSDIIQAPPI